jgi:uncharacterized protein YjbJ (UPF0337 family)
LQGVECLSFEILFDVPSFSTTGLELMNEDQIKGAVNNIAGRVQNAAGALTDDVGQQLKGKARAAAGEAQSRAGDLIEEAREWIAERPLNAMLIVAGAAFLLGRLMSNSSQD